MYIKEVIERVKTYYPSEYDDKEMYPWCNEVSSMLAVDGDIASYEPIRTARYEGEAEIWDNVIRIHDDLFKEGDVAVLKTSAGERVVTVTKTDYEKESQCPYILTVESDLPIANLGTTTAILTREITDKTVCDAPHDVMYIDYLMAKIALFQRDYQMYNQFMASFNSRLLEYKIWFVNHMPQHERKLHGWWK